MPPSPTLNRPQARFLALPHKFRAYVAGYGAGKTWAICAGACKHFWEHPRAHRGYFAPTYAMIRDIYFPTIEEVAFDWGLRVSIKQGNKEVDFYHGNKYRGTTICRSMEKPSSIVGFKIARADVDEIDTLTQEKAEQAWRKIIARLRLQFSGLNGADVATTPEGFKFTWSQWVKQVRANPELSNLYGIVQASTFENAANLPAGYIDSLLESYPLHLIEAYLKGQFVNLASGTVYHTYDRSNNRSTEQIRPNEPLKIGMDFNVGKMCSITHVMRDKNPHAVDEITGAYDTPDIIRQIKERYWEYDGNDYRKTREITVYPDASGDSRKSVNASTSDIALLKSAGFYVKAPAANPPVKDRVMAMNAMFCNMHDERRYFVNDTNCPTFADSLEQQAYNKIGEPDKSNDVDHPNDAAGYFIHREYPVKKPVSQITSLRM